MKKTIALLLCLITIFSLFATINPVSAAYTPILNGRKTIDAQSNEYVVYEVLTASVLPCNTPQEISFDKSLKITPEQFNKVFRLFLSDHPECFWMINDYSYSTLGGYIVKIEPNYRFTGEALTQARAAVNEAVAEIMKNVPALGSDYEKALAIHDQLVNRVEYVKTGEHQSAYGALVAGKAVCAGYAAAYQLLLQNAGVNCWTVQGNSVNPTTGDVIPHAWNLVWFDGNCVYTDATWDDQKENIFHYYFGISLAEMEDTHFIDSDVFKLPQCNHTNLSYFDVNSFRVISTITVDDLVDCFGPVKDGARLGIFCADLDEYVAWLQNTDNVIELYSALNGDQSTFKYSSVIVGEECQLKLTGFSESAAPPEPVIYPVGEYKLESTTYSYSGSPIKPKVIIKDTMGNPLVLNKDYTVTYPQNSILPGKYSVNVSFIGNYSGSLTMYYNVMPGQPSNVTASASSSSVKLSWPKVEGATGYRIYRYDVSSGEYKNIKSYVTDLTYTVTGLAAGTEYIYGVRAYTEIEENSYLWGDIKPVSVTTLYEAPAAPSKLTVSSRTTSSVKLSWPKVTGATGYRVYRYDASTKTYKTVATTKNLYYSVTGLKAGTNYTFAVKAYKTVSDSTLWSARKTLATSTTPKAPASFKVSTRNTSSIKLSWPKATGATGYRIYRYDSSTKTYKTVATTTNLSYTVKSLKSATNYTFRIKSYKKLSDGTTIWSGYRSLTTATNPVAPLISSVKSPAKGKVTLKWNDVARESGYQIYYSTSKSGTYKLLDTVSANDVSETCAGLTSGKTYYFKVRAYKTVNSTKVYSSFSPVKGLKIK